MSFKVKILIIFASIMILSVVAAELILSMQLRDLGTQGLIDKSRAILSRVEVVRDYVAEQGGFRLATQQAIENYPDGNLPIEVKKAITKHVPVFAAMQVGKKGAEEENYSFRIFSQNPRNKDNLATEQEAKILARFEADSKLQEIVDDQEHQIIVYRPVRIYEKNGCMSCHGQPSTSPFKNGKDILGYKMEGWSDGHLHAVFAIVSNTEKIKAATAKSTFLNIVFLGLSGFTLLGIGVLVINKPIHRLSQIVNAITESGLSVRSTSKKISSAADELSSSVHRAASSIEETTASTVEIASMIKLNTSHAENAMQLSKANEEQARKGAEEVRRLIEAMGEISESSTRIAAITNVIDDLAFQTNLLSLNAAVEAARAGEQGKGFAVVADAVRALAQKSSVSAKQISDLIHESVEKVKKGTEIAHESGVSLEEIVRGVEKVSSLNTEISAASSEQDVGLGNISKAISEMDSTIQINDQAAQNSAKSSKELLEESAQLDRLVTELKKTIYGKVS